MNKWNHYIEISKEYYSQFMETSIMSDSENVLIKNNLINTYIGIINSEDANKNIKFIEKCPSSTTIANLEKNREAIIQSIENESSIELIDVYPYIYGKANKEIYQIQYYDNISIERIQQNHYALKDYINLFCEMKGIEYIDSITNNNIFSPRYFTYVAYHNSIPAGIFSAIERDGCAFIMNAFVLPRYRESGVLSALSKRARHDASINEIYEYATIAISDYSQKVLSSHGMTFQFTCDVWSKND